MHASCVRGQRSRQSLIVLVYAQAVDLDAFEDITELTECTLPPMSVSTEEAFSAAFGNRCFTCVRSDGVDVELMLGGKTTPVTLANCNRYCNLLLQYRLTECSRQISAMRRGFACVVPLRALRLFTWRELEVRTAVLFFNATDLCLIVCVVHVDRRWCLASLKWTCRS